jgi:sugar phosphate isomerase/epimerase
MMRLACGDHSFPLLEHDLVLDLIAGMRFEGFDLALMGNRSHIRPEHIRTDPAAAAADIGRRIRKRGLEVSDVFVIPWTDFVRFAPNHPDAEERRASRALFTDMFKFARLLRAPGITLLPGIDFDACGGHEASLRLAAEELQWRAEQLTSAGMRFSVECHMGSVAATPADVLKLVGLAPDLQLTLDYTHFIAPGFEQPEIDRLLPYAGHVQVRGGRPGRGQCGLRENTIDYEAVIDRLSAAGYEGFITIEYVWIEWEHMNECDNVSETIMLRDRLRAKLDGRPWRYSGSST